MILFLKMWCENIIVGVVLTIIIEMISPNRFMKYIKVIIGIFIMYLVISPIVENISLFTLESVLEEIEVYSDKLLYDDGKFKSRNTNDMNNIFIDGMKISIKNKIKEIGYKDCVVDIIFDENNLNIKSVIVDINEENDKENDIQIESKKDEIKDIILKEIDIDKNLIIFK